MAAASDYPHAEAGKRDLSGMTKGRKESHIRSTPILFYLKRLYLLSRVGVTVDGVRIGELIY
jgi:hypothetical protein